MKKTVMMKTLVRVAIMPKQTKVLSRSRIVSNFFIQAIIYRK